MGYQAWNEANSIWQPCFPDVHCCRSGHISDHYIWPTQGKLIYVGIIRVVCLFVTGHTVQYHGGLRSRELGQAPMLQVFLTPRQALSSHPRQDFIVKYFIYKLLKLLPASS